MTETEARILQNQIEIMWTLAYLLRCAKPDLVGKAGELDKIYDDLAHASKDTKKFVNVHGLEQRSGSLAR